jgi:hypothetical protein
MRFFHPLYSLVVAGNLWLILLSKISQFSNLVKQTSKYFLNSKDYKYVIIFTLMLVVVKFISNRAPSSTRWHS